ncbi:MAG TPA: DUF3417 domain-containing protein [Gemmatimonadaceae bacterium]|nr:DUF3417 domain-containing protein [Gemmatimonadaceae bacterium]
MSPRRLEALATDPHFLERYDAVMRWFAAETSFEHTWFSRVHPELRPKTIAYFCAEFGFHSSVPVNAGGKDHSRPTRRPIFCSMGACSVGGWKNLMRPRLGFTFPE